MSYARSAVTRMTLDMSRLDLQRSETVTLGDTNRRWEVTFTNGGAPFRLPPNWTAALTGIKPDGNGLQNGCSVVDGKIIYDFAAGKEIATCVGSYPIQFDVWDEVGELVASPKVYINVLADVRPHAELESNGQYTQIGDLIGRVNQTDADVDNLAKSVLAQGTDITALKEKITTAGTIIIPAEEWTDTLPKLASPAQPVLAKGMVAILMPGNTASQIAARKAKITVQSEPYRDGKIIVQREDGEAPTDNITLDYIIIKVDNPEAPPKAALIGVDAYGGNASGVDETAVRAIITAMLGNVANERQYSSANPPPYPVTSVNGKTGAVNLFIPSEAADVKADPVGTAQTLVNDLARKTAQDLVNYYTKSQTLNKDEINALVSTIPKFKIEVVTSLPASNISEATVYLVKSGADSSNLYTEYIRANGTWERLGAQTVDLTGYATEAWVNELIATYVKTADMEAYVAGLLKDYITKEEADKTYAKPSDVVQATYTALQTAKESGDFDGKTPVYGVDFGTPEEKAEWEAFIVNELAKRMQFKPEIVKSIEECTDPEKLYWLPDHHIYAYMPVKKPAYDNLLTLAVGTDGKAYQGDEIKDKDGNVIGYKPYKTGLKINSKGEESPVTGMCSTGFIPVKGGGTIRIKNTTKASGAGITGADFHLFYKADFTIAASGYYGYYDGGSYNTKPDENGVIEFKLPTSAVYYRYTTGVIDDSSIFTVGQEITDEMVTEYKWVDTGRTILQTPEGNRLIALEEASKNHETRLTKIEEKLENVDFEDKTFAERVADFKNWDRPVFDRIPAYTIGDESKPALTTEMRTSTALYQAYDSLMALVNTDSWTYITKTPLGQDEAGYDVYRYDFKMPDQPRTAVTALSKSVPKVILVSGVHPEWAGVYALYNTMYEIATNPDLADIKHNTHFVVVPMVNAYSCNTGNRKNINGVDIARNFAVDWVETTDTSANTYGGTAPLSELEAQYVDSVMSANTDALYFVSCHNYFGGEEYLNLWACAATKYTHNLGQKLVDKMTRAWGDKYDFVPANTYLGAADIAAPNGSEGKQAIKYGIQGLTLECRNGFGYHSADTYTAFSQSRATEVYINFLLTALGNHEAADKRAL